LTDGAKYVTMPKIRNTRPIVWLKAARRDFEDFPDRTRERLLDALTVVAEGGMPPLAKPLTAFGSGLFELALAFHAFHKKSKTGIKTPKQELDVIETRLRRLKEMVR
jgi:phage-related protein